MIVVMTMIMSVRRLTVVMMPVPVVVLAMRRRRHTQTHLVGSKFPVQSRVLRRSSSSIERPVSGRFHQQTLAGCSQC